eukprot:5590199-Pleurochrysis_carterae.AAC.1
MLLESLINSSPAAFFAKNGHPEAARAPSHGRHGKGGRHGARVFEPDVSTFQTLFHSMLRAVLHDPNKTEAGECCIPPGARDTHARTRKRTHARVHARATRLRKGMQKGAYGLLMNGGARELLSSSGSIREEKIWACVGGAGA